MTLPKWYRDDHYRANRYHLEYDGDAAVIRYGPTAGVKWRSDCAYCTHYTGDSDFFPDHGERPSCRSGKRPHCTCDSCF